MAMARWTLALLLPLAGCTIVGPDYERPVTDNPDAWRVDYPEAAETANTAWWEGFGDPVLDELVLTALRDNKDVRIAAQRVLEFAARVDIARSGYFPQLGYQGGATRNRASREAFGGVPRGDRNYNDYTAIGNLSWELDLWGRIQRSEEAARAELLAEEQNRRSLILSLVSAVASGYATLRQLDRQLVVANETLEARAEGLRLFELKLRGGVVSELEVAQVRTEYEQAAAAIPPIERDIALTENALSILLGANPRAIPRGSSIDDLILPPVPAGVPSTLLIRRPDIQVAEQDLIAANARIGVARAEYFPTISLTGLLGFASDSLSELIGDSANVWSIGGGALGPIFTGGRIDAQVRASEAVQRQALMTYLLTVQNAFREVNDALIRLQKAREQLVAEARRVAALDEYARQARLRYNEGYANYIEVLDAQRFLFDAELEYVAVQGRVFVALVDTYKAMGGGWVGLAQEHADAVDFQEPAGGERPHTPEALQPTQPSMTVQPAGGGSPPG